MNEIRKEIDLFLREWNNKSDYITAHTSGSTGTPKEIHLSKEIVIESAIRTNKFFNIDKNSRLHLCLSPSYIAGKMIIVRAILAGASLTYETPSSSPLSSITDTRPIDLISVVGSQLKGLYENQKASKNSPKINNLLIGGAPMTDDMRRIALSGSWQAFESYGMTETASHVALRRVESNGLNPYTALSGISFDTDSRGCLIINMPEITPIITNDAVTLLSPVEFILHGRADNVIISGGLKVHPEIVEQKIADILNPFGDFYVSSVKSQKWGEEVVLVTGMKKLDTNQEEYIISECKKKVARHEAPRKIIYTAIEHTQSGKLIRRKF